MTYRFVRFPGVPGSPGGFPGPPGSVDIFFLCFTSYYLFTNIYLKQYFRTVSYGFPGFPGAPPGFAGPAGVRSQKVPRVIPSVQSALPRKGDGESSRKLEEVGESSRRLEEVRESWRKLEKVRESKFCYFLLHQPSLTSPPNLL